MTKATLKKTFRWRLKKVAGRVELLFLATMLIVASPILIPYVVVTTYFDDRRKRRIARRMACVRCGRILGIEALQLSDRRLRDHWAEQRRLHPGVRFRIVRTVFAICTTCDAEYGYRDGVFLPIDPNVANGP